MFGGHDRQTDPTDIKQIGRIMMAAEPNVEQIFQSWQECQRGMLDGWSAALKANPMTAWNDMYEAILRSQAAMLRVGQKGLDTDNGFTAVARSWIKRAEALTDIGVDCQRKTSQAWFAAELRPESVMKRWTAPWMDVTKTWQEAAQKMVDMQATWIKSLVATTSGTTEPEPSTPPVSEKAAKSEIHTH
jgi:hypothetical protein